MTLPPDLLIVDDTPQNIDVLSECLAGLQARIRVATTGEKALELAQRQPPDLILLDVMMPGIDGFETLRRIRAQSQVPVILVTARVADADKLRGFQNGADDYLTKPFNPDELSARVAAVLRRSGAVARLSSSAVLTYPNAEIDLERRKVTVNGAEVRLSRTEWELLSLLAANPGRVMLHGELLGRIWGPEFRHEVHCLRTWVSRLRSKLEPTDDAPPLITTFPGIGYRMESPPGSD